MEDVPDQDSAKISEAIIKLEFAYRSNSCLLIGTPKIYTTTGFGTGKNREMAGVDDLVVYIYIYIYICKLL